MPAHLQSRTATVRCRRIRHARLDAPSWYRIDSDALAATDLAESIGYRFLFFFAIRTPKAHLVFIEI
jgi:hypothetical protein